MSFLSILLLLFAGGGAGNDLLDFVPTGAYFKTAGIELSVEALTELLDAPPAGEPAARPGDSARRQLALRALGELGDAAALPAIEKFTSSADPLVADYARAARAAIVGEPYTRPAPARELLRQDLACLPSGVGAVGRISAAPGSGAVMLVKQLAELNEELEKRGGHVLGGGEIEEMEARLAMQGGKVIAMLGNVRLDSITFGVASDIGEDKGFVVAVARGLYDREAAGRLLAELGEGGVREAGGLDFLEVVADHLYVAPVSDELLVFAAGAGLAEIPLAEVGAKVRAGGGDFALGKDLAMLLDKADTDAPLWALAKVGEAYEKVPYLKPFDTVVLEGNRIQGGTMALSVTGRGEDPEEIAGVVRLVTGQLTLAREEFARDIDKFPPAIVFDQMLKSVSIAAEDGTATLSADLPRGGALAALPVIILRDAAPLPKDDAPPAGAPKRERALE